MIVNSITEVLNYIEAYQGIIFDLDDTLYSEKEYVRSGYSKVAEALDGKVETERRLWELFEQGKKAIDELLHERRIYTEKQKDFLVNVYRSQFPNIHLYQGVASMLHQIKKQNKRVGIITDGRVDGQKNKLMALCLNDIVEDIIITDELGGIEFRKPNPAAFVLLKEKWDIPYEKLVYIGDNVKKDFIAPEKLGMNTIWVKNPDGLYTGGYYGNIQY